MTGCASLTANASQSAAAALRAVDCIANETTASAFGRLFGSNGALLPALTGMLTLYIVFFAISLLTGRSRIGISALTPRMLTLGIILTFTTSWVAYQSVVWSLAIGAPDQIASVLTGATGSATKIFADRVDIIFAVIAEVAELSSSGQQSAANAGSFTPVNLMWLGALLLLLGTVGMLVTARIALAILLALGPIFILFGLFSGTRGLCAGWLRGLVMTAITPLFVVLGGGLILELLVPVISGLRGENGVDGRAAIALFLVAAVHVSLMAMTLKVIGAMVTGWTVFGLGTDTEKSDARAFESHVQQIQAPAILVSQPQFEAQTQGQSASQRASVISKAVTSIDAFQSSAAAKNDMRGTFTPRSIQIADAVTRQQPFAHSRSRQLGQQMRQNQRKIKENVR